MVIVCFSLDKDGQYLGKTSYLKESMFERMTALWKQLMDEGRITQVYTLFYKSLIELHIK